MVKVTFGEKEQRLKQYVYAFGILLLIIVGSCTVCRRIDWSRVQTREMEKRLLELEAKTLLEHTMPEKVIERFVAHVGVFLRDRWLIGYLYSEKAQKGYFVGRIPSPDFRLAVEAQVPAIAAGKPVEKKKIPRLRTIIEFKQIRCRLLIAEPEPREIPPSGPAR